jgi:perosamine synthetase
LIPVNAPWLGEEEIELAHRAVSSGWISGQGEYVTAFEQKWAEICGRREGITVSSGTAALETVIHALDMPADGEVIMPTFTMISCLAAVLRNNLAPVFVDADPRTWCMDVTRIEQRISPRTEAIMVVHTYGHPVDMDPVLALAEKYGLKIIEDAAEAHGARCRGRVCGSFGDASIFSFYSSKIVATGEGGMVVCDDESVAESCRNYRNLYFDRKYRFLHGRLGQNFRMTNVQAAIGCAQADKLPRALRRKERMAALYDKLLGDVAELQLPPRSDWCDNVHWVYGIVLAESCPFDAQTMMDRLREKGVDSRLFFLGMHEQPITKELGIAAGESYPVAELLAKRGLYLPSGLSITEDEIRQVATTLKSCLVRKGSSATVTG